MIIMGFRYHGKYTRASKTNPRAIARCDYSGLMVQHALLQDQMQYSGRGLIKTGYKVFPKFLDKPNAQDLAPLVFLDPIPIENPRPDNVVNVVQPMTLLLDVSGDADITLTKTQYANLKFIFYGVLTGDILISIPAIFNEFYVLDQTTGDFKISLQIIDNYATRLDIRKNDPMLISCDSISLKIINPN